MKHADIRQKLSAYLDNAVTPEERVIIEEHLGSCRICSVALVELEKTVSHVKNLEELEPPVWMAQKIMALVNEESERKTGIFRRLFFPLHIKLPIEAMALVLVTVTGYLVFRTVQPQMQLSGTPAREEYSRTLPEAPTAPVPSTAPMKKEQLQEKTEGKVQTVKPLEQKPQHPAREAGAPAPAQPPAAILDTTVPLRNKAVPPVEQAPEVMKKHEVLSAPSPQAERPMQSTDLTADGARMEERSSYALKSKSLRAKPEMSFSLTLNTKDISYAGREIEKKVLLLGGRIVRKEPPVNTSVFTILIEAQKIKEFKEKLGLLGTVTEKGAISDGVGKAMEIKVIIESRHEP